MRKTHAKPGPGRPSFLVDPVKLNVLLPKKLLAKLNAKVNRLRKTTDPTASVSSAARQAIEAFVEEA